MGTIHLKDCTMLAAIKFQYPHDSLHSGVELPQFLEVWNAVTDQELGQDDIEFCTTCVRRAFKMKRLGLLQEVKLDNTMLL